MTRLTPADLELTHLCDQFQAAEFYPLEGVYVEPDADERAAARAAGFPDAPDDPTLPVCSECGRDLTPQEATESHNAGCNPFCYPCWDVMLQRWAEEATA